MRRILIVAATLAACTPRGQSMSSNYTGDDTATQAPGPAPDKNVNPIVVLPADGDALNAASVAQAYKALADFADMASDRCGFVDEANTWTPTQTFSPTADTTPAQSVSVVPTNRQLADLYYQGSRGVRFYFTLAGDLEITVNAQWDGANWARDSAGHSMHLKLLNSGIEYSNYDGAGASPWAHGAWVLRIQTDRSLLDVLYAYHDVSTTKVRHTEDRSSATAGAGQGVTSGYQYRDTTPIAWGRFRKDVAANTLTLIRGANISAVTWIAAGQYKVTLVNGAANKLAPVVTPATAGVFAVHLPLAQLNTADFRIDTYDLAGVSTEIADLDEISFVVFGG